GDLLAQQMRKLDRILQGIALVRRDLKSGPVDHAVAVAAGDAGAADALGRRPRARSAHSGFTRTRPATVTTRPTLGIHHVRLAGVLAALCLHLGHLAGGGGGGWIVQGQLEARIAWNRRPSVAEAVMPRGASAPAPARRNRRRGWREGLQQPVHARAHVMAEGQEGRAELVVLGFEGGDLVGESVRFLKRLVA